MKTSVRKDHDPSGMSNAGMERFEKLIKRLNMTAVGRVSNPRGDVFVAERFLSMIEGWEVAWAARDAFSSIDFAFGSTQEQRIAASVRMANDLIKVLDGVQTPTH